jgi:hypothetical protein
MLYIVLISLAHLKEKIILKQWKHLESYYLIMIRMTKDVFNAIFFDVVNERLFIIVNKIYESYEFYHSSTIRVKMIIRQHDYKKNEWDLKNAQSDLKKKQELTSKKIEKEKATRDEVLRDETVNYINDVDETLSVINSINNLIKIFRNLVIINLIKDEQSEKKNTFDERFQRHWDEIEKQNESSKINI